MKINPKELKSIKSISEHYPKGNGTFGVQTGYIYRLMNEGKLHFDKVEIEGITFYIIPESDQQKPDWGLGQKLQTTTPKEKE